MARTDLQVNIRMPAALKTLLEDSTSATQRSLNAEILARLEASFASAPASFVADASIAICAALVGRGAADGKAPDMLALADTAVTAAQALAARLQQAT